MWGGVCDPFSQQGLGEVPPPVQGAAPPSGGRLSVGRDLLGECLQKGASGAV